MECDQVLEPLALHAASSITLAIGRSGSKRVDFEGLRHSSRHGFSIQPSGTIHTDLAAMPRTTVTRRRPSRREVRATRESSTWVRKNMLMDQKKLDEAKRVLRTTTETETIDAALDEIAFRHGLVDGMRALKRSGGLKDLFDER